MDKEYVLKFVERLDINELKHVGISYYDFNGYQHYSELEKNKTEIEQITD